MDYPSNPDANLQGGKFTDGDPQNDIPPSTDLAEWANGVTDELLEVIQFGGLTPDENDVTQVRQAIMQLLSDASKSVTVDSSTFEGTVSDGDAVYWDGANSRFAKAIADGTDKQHAVGFADVTNSTLYAWGLAEGLFSSLSPGTRYYLSDSTAGAITSNPPATRVLMGIGRAADSLFIDIDSHAGLGSMAYEATSSYGRLSEQNTWSNNQLIADSNGLRLTDGSGGDEWRLRASGSVFRITAWDGVGNLIEIDGANGVVDVSGEIDATTLKEQGERVATQGQTNVYPNTQRIDAAGGLNYWAVRSIDSSDISAFAVQDGNSNTVLRVIALGMDGAGAGYCRFNDADHYEFVNGPVHAENGLSIGGGAVINGVLSASASVSGVALSAGDEVVETISVSGVAAGDRAVVSTDGRVSPFGESTVISHTECRTDQVAIWYKNADQENNSNRNSHTAYLTVIKH